MNKGLLVSGREVRLVWEHKERQYVHTGRIASASARELYIHPPYDQWENYPWEPLACCSLFVKLAEGEVEFPALWNRVETEGAFAGCWLVEFSKISAMNPLHRKRHYRVSIASPMWLTVLREVCVVPTEYLYRGEIISLTRTGMRVRLPLPLPKREALEVVFNIVPHRMVFGATVAYARTISDSEQYNCEAVLHFVGLSALQRDRIAYYVDQQSPLMLLS